MHTLCDSTTRPAFIPAPNTARTRMVYSLDNQEVMNVFYFQAAASFTFADLTNLNAEVIAAWTADIRAAQPAELRLEYVESTALDNEPDFQVTTNVGLAGGYSVSQALPSNVTISIAFKTGVTGRSNRGRMFWLQLAEAMVTNNTLDPITASSLVTRMTDFFTAVETGTSTFHAIVSYCTGGAWRTTASVLPVETYVLVDHVVDSQRRRLPKRGR